MSAAIKDVSGKRTNSDLGAEKSELAVLEDASHERITFGGDVHADPKQRELSVEQVECEQQAAFGQLPHGDLARQTLLNCAPIYAETPGADWRPGVPDVTGGTR